MRVLVPLDGSRLSEGILGHVRRLLLNEKSEIHLLRVLAPDVDPGAEEEAEHYLERCKQELVESGETVHCHTAKGEAAEGILDFLEGNELDLVAMATHGRTGLERWVRGSVAERVLRHTPAPIYLANPWGLLSPTGELRFERILVPLDGSETSARILPVVTDLALDSKADAVLLHVDEPDETGVHFVPEVAARQAQERAEGQLEPLRAQLEERGVTAHVVGGYGDPAAVILDAATRHDADLIAMASHGRTGLSRWRFGSVAEKVLRDCRTPLLVRRMSKQG